MIYPRNNQGFWSLNPKDQEQFVNLINDKNVDIIGIGNRTGFREMERIVVELIQKNMFKQNVKFTSVNEDGASIYR